MMWNGPILHSQNQLQKMFGMFARLDLIVVEDLDSLQPLTSIHSKAQVSMEHTVLYFDSINRYFTVEKGI